MSATRSSIWARSAFRSARKPGRVGEPGAEDLPHHPHEEFPVDPASYQVLKLAVDDQYRQSVHAGPARHRRKFRIDRRGCGLGKPPGHRVVDDPIGLIRERVQLGMVAPIRDLIGEHQAEQVETVFRKIDMYDPEGPDVDRFTRSEFDRDVRHHRTQ